MLTTHPQLYETLDDRFRTGKCAAGDSKLETLHEGCRWAEGPVYVPAGRYVVWSDIPTDRLLRWDETTGSVGVFRSPAGHPNGNTLDAEGRLITCEQGNRRVTRTEHDGTVTVIADRYRGKRLNSPNDAVVRSDGSIWFSDPDSTYHQCGIGSPEYERGWLMRMAACWRRRSARATRPKDGSAAPRDAWKR